AEIEVQERNVLVAQPLDVARPEVESTLGTRLAAAIGNLAVDRAEGYESDIGVGESRRSNRRGDPEERSRGSQHREQQWTRAHRWSPRRLTPKETTGPSAPARVLGSRSRSRRIRVSISGKNVNAFSASIVPGQGFLESLSGGTRS